MIQTVFDALGEEMELWKNGAMTIRFLGRLLPCNLTGEDTGNAPVQSGLAPQATFRLLAEGNAMEKENCGQELVWCGRRFAILRAEPVYVNGILHYWSALVLEKGAADA